MFEISRQSMMNKTLSDKISLLISESLKHEKGRQECQPRLLTNPLNSATKLQIYPTFQN